MEYTAVRVGRGLAALAHGAARALLTLLAVVLRPAVRAADSFKAALTHPRQLAGYAVPLLAAGVLAWFVRTALARPFVLRVEVGGQVVGYVTDEQAFDAARADVQARLTGVADWDVQPAYTLVMADADTRPMTERETADAILRAAGGEITTIDRDSRFNLILRVADYGAYNNFIPADQIQRCFLINRCRIKNTQKSSADHLINLGRQWV